MPETSVQQDYHLEELQIARDQNDPRHAVPVIGPGEVVLDLGCGAGQLMIAACPDRVSYGIDVDYPSLRFGQSLTSRVRFCCGSAECLPYKSGMFDLVVCRVTLPYTNLRLSLPEIYRILRPGGRVWLMLIPFGQFLRFTKQAQTWRAWIKFGYVVANSVYFHWFQRMFRFPGKHFIESYQTVGGIRRAMHHYGFRDIDFERGQRFIVKARKP
jgi:ubiquinone/menaquinone biosynthesis C-methylase UbiE